MDQAFTRLLVAERIGQLQAEAERERLVRSGEQESKARHSAVEANNSEVGARLRWRLIRG